MSVCVFIHSSGTLKVSAETDCTEFVLLNQVEFQNLQSGSLQQMNETLHLLFAFDAELFGVVEGAMIFAFLTSHFGGRVVRWLGKS
ncbi:hypothetical protein [Colwellia sp. TT2012]|uniref:hypothetical protein n=1 Tax=Colwellia sp. TT2012 TaxID=1720342 RepID=UPI00070FDF70|nr:hypothetical protein [Colwellia sp. TT2012]